MALKTESHTGEDRKYNVGQYQPGKPAPTPASTKTSHVTFLGSSTFLCKMKEEDFFFCFL